MNGQETYDLAIVGGGLAGALLALAVQEARPGIRLALIEAGAQLGGNHVWSFFDSDLDAAGRALLAPMVGYRWEAGNEVRFPGFGRALASPYNSITSTSLDAHVRAMLDDAVLCGTAVTTAQADGVTLADGRTIRAGGVIDARGLAGPDDPLLAGIAAGWQKFVGQTLRLAAPHGLSRPIIMDASVAQIDGYRFVYVLPLGARDVFVEDTYYSDDAALDVAAIEDRIADYAAAQGWQVTEVLHQETGVLPVVIGGAFDALWPRADQVARAGVRAGLFHPVTGYSLADAVRFALHVARLPDLSGAALARSSRTYAQRHWRSGGYYRLLDTMLFRAAVPEQRYRIFERFYRLSEKLIGRFYAGRSSYYDRIRILCGRPPVPIRAAMHALSNRKH